MYVHRQPGVTLTTTVNMTQNTHHLKGVIFNADNQDAITKNMSKIREIMHNAAMVYDYNYRVQRKQPTQDTSSNLLKVRQLTQQLKQENITFQNLYC